MNMEAFKLLNLSKNKAYVLVFVLLTCLIAENIFGVNIPVFEVTQENTYSYMAALLALIGIGIKNASNAAKALETANQNAVAAAAIASDLNFEDLKNQIELIKQLTPKG